MKEIIKSFAKFELIGLNPDSVSLVCCDKCSELLEKAIEENGNG